MINNIKNSNSNVNSLPVPGTINRHNKNYLFGESLFWECLLPSKRCFKVFKTKERSWTNLENV